MADHLRHFYMTGQAEFSASRNPERPVIAYHGGGWRSEIVRYDRSGERLGTLGEPAAFDQIDISPDGRRAVVDVLDRTNGGRDLWIYDLESARARRLTLHRADEQDPVWSSDGGRILYRSDENGPPDLYRRSADGSGAPERILESGSTLTPEDWSRQGQVLYQVSSRSTGSDQWIVHPDDGSEPRALLETRYAEWGGVFSPDGRWVAFSSNESGRTEVYVAPVDDPGARIVVSYDGGLAPRWRSDASELYFPGSSSRIHVVEVRTEPSFQAGQPRVLFEADGPVYDASYDVTRDGSLFLVNQVLEDDTRAPIQVILDWPAATR